MKQSEQSVTSDATSDRFSYWVLWLLWIFWPSFYSAVVSHEQMPLTVMNTVLSLCGATLTTYIVSSFFRNVDTCGVHNLHGMPGILGGCVAILAVPNMLISQLTGILFTVLSALAAGFIGGYIIRLTGSTKEAFEDSESFGGLEEELIDNEIEIVPQPAMVNN